MINSQYSSSQKSESNQQSINVDKIQTFIQQKQQELNELQKFLITQFQQIERFKGMKQKLHQLLNERIVSMFTMIKQQLKAILHAYSTNFSKTNVQWGKFVDNIINEKQQKIQQLQLELSSLQLSFRIEKQKNQQKMVNLHNETKLRLQKLIPQSGNNNHQKVINNAPYNNNGYYRIEQPKSFFKASSERYLQPNLNQQIYRRSSSNCSDNFSILKSSGLNETTRSHNRETTLKISPGRTIMKEVKRALKQQFENKKNLGQYERKKCVKQKIEQIKNRNSVLFHEANKNDWIGVKRSEIRF